MPPRHVVVDGSNIATEGRSLPSLTQLDEAVQEFQREYPGREITVVVDATFGHRIDPSERAMFEEAEAHGELVSPPAGAIGRGDAFLLLIAERTGAMVLSNDSFQEFHGDYEWLFDKDRLVGGKPVPGVGWIFTPRTPVRGLKSREAVKEAKRTRVRIGSKEASQPMPVPRLPPPGPVLAAVAQAEQARQAGTRAVAAKGEKVRKAIAAATKEVEAPGSPSAERRRRRRGAGPPPQAVNEPLAFITFIAEHPLGSEVEGEVEGFTSHGAFVAVDGARGYVPLSGLGEPPPTRARSVLGRGERRVFVLQALDAQRRGLELALPEFAHVAGSPSEETVEAEIAGVERAERQPEVRAPAKRVRKKAPVPEVAAPALEVAEPTPGTEPAPGPEPAVDVAQVPAKRVRKKAPVPEVAAPVVGDKPPAPAKRVRKKAPVPEGAAPVVGDKPPAPAKRVRKKAPVPEVAAPVAGPEPVVDGPPAPAKRARKKASAPADPDAVEVAPVPARRARRRPL